MFEGLIHRVLVGYLGRYVKDFHKHQLKLSLWNEEVILENVELIPEAFDFLQLPFALKEGRVGRLSIRISWKKLVWDHSNTVVIVLQDVFLCASPRDDQEWNPDAVEKREFAGKKAKLAAAELEKLSRRVCDNRTGNSFFSFITAKVLESIQLSIRNFHVQYCQVQSNSAKVLFGLKFSSLTVRQNPVRFSGVKGFGGQVSKTLENEGLAFVGFGIEGLSIYCHTYPESHDSMVSNYVVESKIANNSSEGKKYDHLLQPFDVSLSVKVNKAGKTLPQCSISAELNMLAISLSEVQLQQILVMTDYLSTGHLREKYRRYRPWGSPLSSKPVGWQKLWWQYAQQSVLSDVRKKLNKTSWRCLGDRLSDRRKYINLYRRKLNFLQQDQSIDEGILLELEQMEKECEVDDILSYRSAAECEMQEVLNSPSSLIALKGSDLTVEKPRNDDHSSGRSSGWLNWLSWGMLGAGGTGDFGQFAGVVSDEVVKDIYEATEFHPDAFASSDADATDRTFSLAIEFKVAQVSATLLSMKFKKIADLTFMDATIEGKSREGLATFACLIKSVQMVYHDKVILRVGQPFRGERPGEDELILCGVQVEMSTKREEEVSAEVTFQEVEATCDANLVLDLCGFITVLQLFQFHRHRVLLSLDGIEDVKTRLASKAEFVLSSHKRLSWDVRVLNVIINIPWEKGTCEQFNLVLGLGCLHCTPKHNESSIASYVKGRPYVSRQFFKPKSYCSFLTGFDRQDVYFNLYNYLQVELEELELKLMMPQCSQMIPLLEKLDASVSSASCIIDDRSMLEQFEVLILIPTISSKFSASICEAAMTLIQHLHSLRSKFENLRLRRCNSLDSFSNQPAVTGFGFSIAANLKEVGVHVELGNNGENSSTIMVSLHQLDLWYANTKFEEGFVCIKELEVMASSLRDQNDCHVLASCGNKTASGYLHHEDLAVQHANQEDGNKCMEGCLLLYYEARKNSDLCLHKLSVELSDADLHCHPRLFGLLGNFVERLSSCVSSFSNGTSSALIMNDGNHKQPPCFEFNTFGYSNFAENGISEKAMISLDRFPFVTILNSGSLDNLEGSLCHSISDWRKLFKLVDKNGRSQKLNWKKGSKNSPSSIPAIGTLATSSARGSVFNIDINISGTRLHFHDSSSCIIGTVNLPRSESSVIIQEDFMDLLCSTDGLTVTSPCCLKDLRDVCWVPSLPSISPVVNVRVRKANVGALSSPVEVSIGIQHVYCMLPAEYLAIIIGYILLPDWSPNLREHQVTTDLVKEEKEIGILLKFEILDSVVVSPVEQDKQSFIKIELQQFYCSFSPNSDPTDSLKYIPREIVVSADRIVRSSDCLNIFARNLLLSFVSCKDDNHGCLMLGQDNQYDNITLIAPLCADVWVRIPCKNESAVRSSAHTCIMTRILDCQLIADDHYTLNGLEALQDVLVQFSEVDNESKKFSGDVSHFVQWKKRSEETREILPIDARPVFIEIKCCIDALSITLHQLGNSLVFSKPVVKLDLPLMLSASLIDDRLVTLGIRFSSVRLESILHSVILVQCNATQISSSVFEIYFSESAEGRNDLYFSLPSLDVLLDFSAWSEVLDIHNSYTKTLSGAPQCSAGSGIHLQNEGGPTCPDREYVKPGSFILHVKSGNIGLSICIPVRVVGTEDGDGRVDGQKISRAVVPRYQKFVKVTANSQNIELLVEGKKVNVRSIWEDVSGSIVSCDQGSTTTWPFFDLSNLNVTAETANGNADFLNLGIQCDSLELWLSHHMFCFWYDVQFDIPEESSSDPLSIGVDVQLQLRKASLLISDERWSCSGPLLDVVLRKCLLHAVVVENNAESTIMSTIEVNYKNIHKVLWEPFVEPWEFRMDILRKPETTALTNRSVATDIRLTSTSQLNLNFTESFVECIARMVDMVTHAWQLGSPNDPSKIKRSSSSQLKEDMPEGPYAPYQLQNLTSLPLVYCIFEGQLSSDEFSVSEMDGGKSVQPGALVPIYFNETQEELMFRFKPAQSSEKLCEKQLNGAVHRFMSIQLDGMSVPSASFSMDLVGRTYLEVDFAKASSKGSEVDVGTLRYNGNIQGHNKLEAHNAFVFPVVVDVSVERYTKLIRFYSTVVLYNATMMPLQLRFDIPFGVSPKVLDPLYPGEEIPVPLHLAEAGRMRCRPVGDSYLWSEVHGLSNIISPDSKGFLRPFVCYPSYPSSHPFRCCLSVESFLLPLPLAFSKTGKGLTKRNETWKQSVGSGIDNLKISKKRFMYQVMLSTPFIINNYLPCSVSLTFESGGATHTVLLSEVETSFHHVDPSHDLGLEFFIEGFKSSSLKFRRAEAFSAVANLCGEKFSMVETITFYPENSNSGSNLIVVTVEKIMDALSGAREVSLFVPFLLYNCTGLPLNISESSSEMIGCHWTIPSCYELIEPEVLQGQKDGLQLLSFDRASPVTSPRTDVTRKYLAESCIVSQRKIANSNLHRVTNKPVTSFSVGLSQRQPANESVGPKTSLSVCSSEKSISEESPVVDTMHSKVNASIFCPVTTSISELMVRVSRSLRENNADGLPHHAWSAPFLLVPPSGSSTVLVPQSSSLSNGAFIISVTCSALDGLLSGRTQAVTFQPRYIISNACTKDLFYKQKGTRLSCCLGVGQHSYLLWTDTMREMLVSICFDEAGWQWSGGFLPDHLGDTQLKMRHYDGSLRMIRVEVQNADVSSRDEKIVGNLDGNSGTNLILLSEDNTGFMPYRIDNLTKEKLRVYQQKCESFDTIVHPYTSCPYAWDEPCYPHRLTVEVPGERVLGFYDLDNQKESTAVHLKATPEKPERTFLISVHAEGAIKVLSLIDSSFHIPDDVKDSRSPSSPEKSKHEKKPDNFMTYKNKCSFSLASIGISVMNATPQELLFASAKVITFDLVQSLDRQKFSFQISSLQIDNQLAGTPYPVILSFNQEYRSKTVGQKVGDDGSEYKREEVLQVVTESAPALSLAVATLEKKDLSLLSFEYIILRVANFHLELEQELLWSLLDLFKTVYSRFRSWPHKDSMFSSFPDDMSFIDSLGKGATQLDGTSVSAFATRRISNKSLPSVAPIGAPWQQIYLSTRRSTKLYVEVFNLAPIKFSLSFSSSPWTRRKGGPSLGASLIHRSLIALADVEGAQIQLKQLTFAHQMGSLDSMQNILIRHYTRQVLHEMYKVFGSAGVIGNPIGFARSLGLGIRDFLAVPSRSLLRSPSGLIMGMAQGTTSLVSNTVYAFSDAATQFSKAAHKGIVALTLDDQSAMTSEKHHEGGSSHSKGVLHEIFEGLTGLLQSPVKGAEKHGLPGVLSGFALGVTGLLARPAASILEVTGKTAQSIRNKSRIYQWGFQRYRIRFPRPLSRDLPLRPYSWDEAIGTAVLMDAEDSLKFKEENLMLCKSLKQAGRYVVVTERLMLIVSCSSLADLGKPEFRGVPIDIEWSLDLEINLDSVIHADTMENVVHVVGSTSDVSTGLIQHQRRRIGHGSKATSWNNLSSPLPLFQTNLELTSPEDAQALLQVVLSTIEQGNQHGWGSSYVLHQSSLSH